MSRFVTCQNQPFWSFEIYLGGGGRLKTQNLGSAEISVRNLHPASKENNWHNEQEKKDGQKDSDDKEEEGEETKKEGVAEKKKCKVLRKWFTLQKGQKIIARNDVDGFYYPGGTSMLCPVSKLNHT